MRHIRAMMLKMVLFERHLLASAGNCQLSDCLLSGRWREAVCVMMIYSDPGITPDSLNSLGQQLAKLFRQVNTEDSSGD